MVGDLSLLCWRYFSKCIKHGSAIEGQIHSKSRKSWKTRQNWKRVFLHVLPRIIHSPFITKLARSPVGAFKWRFNWNDIGGEKDRLLRQIVANVPRPHSEAAPCIAFQIGNFGFFRLGSRLFFWPRLDSERMLAWDRSLPRGLIIHTGLSKWSEQAAARKTKQSG